jgi:hypothetical protein
MARRVAEEFVAKVNAAAQRLDAARGRSVASRPGPAEEIEKLGKLHDSGVITAQEFESKKAKLLARI